MITYKLSPDFNGSKNETIIRSDGAQIPPDPANTDYQEFLLWKSEGNEPTPADSE